MFDAVLAKLEVLSPEKEEVKLILMLTLGTAVGTFPNRQPLTAEGG